MNVVDFSNDQSASISLDMPKPINKRKYIKFGLILLILFLFVGGYFLFISKSSGIILNPLANDALPNAINDIASKVQNPITGELVSDFEAAKWANARPLGVMINNHTDARPQSGLINADEVYEIVAEGGITRFLAFFLSNTPEKIGPVRSTREYYLVLVKELGDAMIMHIGWSPQALEAIETWPVRSLGRGGAQFWRDQARIDAGIAIEHTAYVNGPELRALGEELGWEGKRDFQSYKFKDTQNIDTTAQCLVGECTPITIDFWFSGDYSAIWKYNRTNNSYMRFMGYDASDQPVPHLDQESQTQIEVKNLVVQFVPEVSIIGDDKNRLAYELEGSGSGIVFIDGRAIDITWRKADRDSRTLFYDTNGNEVEFNRGKFWVSIVPDRNVSQVVYTSN